MQPNNLIRCGILFARDLMDNARAWNCTLHANALAVRENCYPKFEAAWGDIMFSTNYKWWQSCGAQKSYISAMALTEKLHSKSTQRDCVLHK